MEKMEKHRKHLEKRNCEVCDNYAPGKVQRHPSEILTKDILKKAETENRTVYFSLLGLPDLGKDIFHALVSRGFNCAYPVLEHSSFEEIPNFNGVYEWRVKGMADDPRGHVGFMEKLLGDKGWRVRMLSCAIQEDGAGDLHGPKSCYRGPLASWFAGAILKKYSFEPSPELADEKEQDATASPCGINPKIPRHEVHKGLMAMFNRDGKAPDLMQAFPFGFNPDADHYAAIHGFGHWTCGPGKSKKYWVRKDGHLFRRSAKDIGPTLGLLKDYDKRFPIKAAPTRWQHEDCGRITESESCPGARWQKIPDLGQCMVCGAPATQLRRDIDRSPRLNQRHYVEYEAGPVE